MTSRRSFFRRVVGLVGAGFLAPFVKAPAAVIGNAEANKQIAGWFMTCCDTNGKTWLKQAEVWVPIDKHGNIQGEGNTDA